MSAFVLLVAKKYNYLENMLSLIMIKNKKNIKKRLLFLKSCIQYSKTRKNVKI